MIAMPRALKSAGFTLIEVMISVALVATAFVSLLVLQRQNIAAHITIQSATVASMIAEDRLERIVLIAQGFDQLEEYNEDLAKEYPTFEVESVVEEVGMESMPVVALLPAGLTMKKIVVTVSWKEGQTTKQYVLTHFVSQKLL